MTYILGYLIHVHILYIYCSVLITLFYITYLCLHIYIYSITYRGHQKSDPRDGVSEQGQWQAQRCGLAYC